MTYLRKVVEDVSLSFIREDKVARYRERHAGNQRDAGGDVRDFGKSV
jgi:hypothetical protein